MSPRATTTTTNTNTNMTTDKLITKCETQSILLVITNADETISSQGYYWSAQEAIRAARNSGKYYTVRNTDTGKLIEAQW